MCNRQFDGCIFFLSYLVRRKKVTEKGKKEKTAVQVAQILPGLNLQIP